MPTSRLSEDEVDDLLDGRGRRARTRHGRSVDGLADLVAVLHASREVEPAPPMSAELRTEIGRNDERAGRGGHHVCRPEAASERVCHYRRPVLSLAAAAVVLVALVLTASRPEAPGTPHEAASGLGAAVGVVMRPPDDLRGPSEAPSGTLPGDAPPPPTAPAPAAPAPPPPESQASDGAATDAPPTTVTRRHVPPRDEWTDLPSGEVDVHDPADGDIGRDDRRNRDGDRDGDRDGPRSGESSRSDGNRTHTDADDGSTPGSTGTTLPETHSSGDGDDGTPDATSTTAVTTRADDGASRSSSSLTTTTTGRRTVPRASGDASG